jgi:hypothetical protein
MSTLANNATLDKAKSIEYLDVVNTLRAEATDLKECFNRQCFQVIAIVSTFYVFLLRFMFISAEKGPELTINYSLGIAAYVVIILVITVLNVGIYKFESANRLIGYILHLEREGVTSDSTKYEHASILNWETSIKAWRVFHGPIEAAMYEKWTERDSQLFREVFGWKKTRKATISLCKRYLKTFIFKGKFKKDYNSSDKYRWYLPKVLVHSCGMYSPGNYLGRMMLMLYLLGVTALAFVTAGTILGDFESWLRWLLIVLLVLTLLWSTVFMFIRPYLLAKRIESQLFSIHSCSIFWGVVSQAHKRALRIIGNNRPMKHYSFILSCLSLHYLNFGIDRVHEWCHEETFKEAAEYIRDNCLQDYPQNLRVSLQNLINKSLSPAQDKTESVELVETWS